MPFRFNFLCIFWALLFNFLNFFVWIRITDDGSVPGMRIWSIVLIKDVRYCVLQKSWFSLPFPSSGLLVLSYLGLAFVLMLVPFSPDQVLFLDFEFRTSVGTSILLRCTSRKLYILWQALYACNIFITFFTPCNSHLSNIRSYCDNSLNPSYNTCNPNKALQWLLFWEERYEVYKY